MNAVKPPSSRNDPQTDFDRCAVAQRVVAIRRSAQRRHHVVEVEVLLDQRVDCGIGRRVDEGGEVHDAPRVDLRPEDGLGLGLVALGHRDVAHVVAEAGDAHVARRRPPCRGAAPVADPIEVTVGIGDMADDRGPGDPEPGLDVAELPVAVGGLVEVHEVEVDRAPRQLLVGLGVQVQHRLVERRQPGDPHLGRAERVHPGDDPDDVRLTRCASRMVWRIASRDVSTGFHTTRHGDVVGGVEHLDDLLRLGRDLGQDLVAVHRLAAGEEPDLLVGEIRRDVATHHMTPFGACP